MLDEILEVFSAINDGVFLDATLGGAGHSCALLEAHPQMSLLGIDQDVDALTAASENLASHQLSGRATLRHARFDEVKKIVNEEGLGSLAGALFDLGVSSHQFDVSERGFSYRFDAPLDMRMNRLAPFSANDVVNGYDKDQLIRILREYADERFAARISDAIIASRPVRSTMHLAEIVVNAIPAPARRRGGHPAKRTFQAIRIEVNAELQILAGALRDVIDMLAPGARLAVLSYHSGEDRIVKEIMRRAESGDCQCPPGLPCACGAVKLVRRVRVGRQATQREQQSNPRSTSARLRVVEKIEAGQ
ncbi:MAG: S-adenosyl-L-methionine-dependent methyltransferase MraW [Actinomycetota bacterium]